MKLTIPRKTLLTLLADVGRAADTKSTMPQLGCVLLTVKGDTVTACATDLYRSLTGSAPADAGSSDGAAAIPAKELLERVKTLPDGPITLSLEGDRVVLRGATKARKHILSALPAGDFPPMPSPDETAPRLELRAGVLAGLIEQVVDAVSTDETRAHLNSALFEWEGETVRMVSTDGHRLHKAEAKVEGNAGSRTLLIPLRALVELRKLCDTSAKVVLSQVESTAFFETPGLTFSTKTVDAQFPPYAQVIPKTSKHETSVSAAALSESIRAVLVSASAKTGGLKFEFSGDAIKITAQSGDGTACESSDEVPLDTEWSGKPLAIGFNGKYLLDVTKAAIASLGPDAVMRLGLTGDLEPMLTTVGETVCVTMPLRI